MSISSINVFLYNQIKTNVPKVFDKKKNVGKIVGLMGLNRRSLPNFIKEDHLRSVVVS